jgi:iron complex transport system substrate-binding protein
MHVVNIADAKGASTAGGYPQLSAEYIASANPTIIFLADTLCCKASPRSVSHRVAFQSVRAVRKHQVFGLNDDVASRWGPRLVNLVRALARDINMVARGR